MDVSTAFFFGDVEEDIHVIHPLGLDDSSVRVLCGLEKAPRILSRKIGRLMTKHGYLPVNSDTSIHSRPERNIIIAIYVDDVLVASPSHLEIHRPNSIHTYRSTDGRRPHQTPA